MASAAPETSQRHESHDDAHSHASDAKYIQIALILAVFTALETATYFIDWFEGNATRQWLVLGPLMVIKFSMVAWFFMHLKQDSRLFTRVFAGGIVLAIGVYLVVLLTFDQLF